MPTNINADTIVGGAIITGDTSGVLALQSAGTTAISISGANVTVAGTLTTTNGLASPVTVAGNSTAGAEIRLPEDTDNGSNYVAIKAPNALASNLTFTLPSADGTTGQVLQTDGSGGLSFGTVSAGADLQTFSSSGTWTKPAGKTMVMIEIWAGGGGGGGGANGNGSTFISGAAGGGGGAYNRVIVPASSLGSTVSVTIGAGGTGPSAGSQSAGGTGGTTSFGTIAYAFGGLGGAGGAGGFGDAGGFGASGCIDDTCRPSRSSGE